MGIFSDMFKEIGKKIVEDAKSGRLRERLEEVQMQSYIDELKKENKNYYDEDDDY